ncbi:MAG: sulfur oxidation protein SoxZ [Polaromonas sp.]|nr:sulfur oxidation protein SoxZ [Polaromonas sp.]
MADPMRIRAQLSGDKTTVRILMQHEMESGQRKNPSGGLIPAWYIEEVTVTLNGQPVLTAEWGPGMSKNPYLQFELMGASAGDIIRVSWKDSHGDSRSDESAVA